MEQAFEKLKNEGKNDVEGLVRWIKDSKIVDSTKESEDKVRKLFEGVADTGNVQLAKFTEALGKIAAEQKKNIEELTKCLLEQGPNIVNALTAGASAFTGALQGKK